MKRKKTEKPELHGFEALLDRLIADDHVRITRMRSESGDVMIAKVLFDDKAVRKISDKVEYAHAALHIKKAAQGFVEAYGYGKFVHAVTFAELKSDMPFHPRDSLGDNDIKRGDRLAKLLEKAPEIIERRGQAGTQDWSAKTRGQDDGLAAHTRRGARR